MTKQEQLKKNREPSIRKLSAVELADFRYWLFNIGECQICGDTNLDVPHHEPRGIYKRDDRQVCICVSCHRIRHGSIKGRLLKTIDQIEAIAEINWYNYTP